MIPNEVLNSLTEDEWELLWYLTNKFPIARQQEIQASVFSSLRHDVLMAKCQYAEQKISPEGKEVLKTLMEKLK